MVTATRPTTHPTTRSMYGTYFIGEFLHESLIPGTLKESAGGLSWDAAIIQEGFNNSKQRYYTPEAIIDVARLINGAQMFANHPTEADEQLRPERAVQDIIGFYHEGRTQVIGGKLTACATLTLLSREALPTPYQHIPAAVKEAASKGNMNLYELSIYGYGAAEATTIEGIRTNKVNHIEVLASTDLVTRGGASGRLLAAVAEAAGAPASETTKEDPMTTQAPSLKELQEKHPEIFAALREQHLQEAQAAETARLIALEDLLSKSTLAPALSERVRRRAAASHWAPARVQEELETLAEASALLVDSNTLSMRELPTPQPVVRVIEGLPRSETSKDIWMQRMVRGLTFMPGIWPADGVKPFDSLKESYFEFVGGPVSYALINDPYVSNRLMQALQQGLGHFDTSLMGERYHSYTTDKMLTPLKEASILSTTFSNGFGTAVHLALTKQYIEMRRYDDWRKIVSKVTPTSDFLPHDSVLIGGFNPPAAVGQEGTYQPFAVPTEQKVTWTVSKYGGTLTFSLEAISNDRIGVIAEKLMHAALACKVGLYRSVLDLIDTNSTWSGDSVALFDAAHSNKGTTAFSHTQARIALAAMRAQTILSASQMQTLRQGKYFIYPAGLEDIVGRFLTSRVISNSSITMSDLHNATEPNIFNTSGLPVQYTLEGILADYFTDADNWYVVADPQGGLVPTIEMGLWNGREEPEIMQSVEAGLLTDVILYKVRHIYVPKILDYRSFWGGIV